MICSGVLCTFQNLKSSTEADNLASPSCVVVPLTVVISPPKVALIPDVTGLISVIVRSRPPVKAAGRVKPVEPAGAVIAVLPAALGVPCVTRTLLPDLVATMSIPVPALIRVMISLPNTSVFHHFSGERGAERCNERRV